MIVSTLLLPVEKMLNRYLALDNAQANRLASHDNKILQITLLPLHIVFFIQIEQQRIKLKKQVSHPADAAVRTSPFNGLKLMLTPSSTLPEDVSLTGDLHFVQTLQSVFAHLDVDWEAQLSRYVGATVAHGISQQLRKIHTYQRSARESFTRSSKEYLQEELRLFPSRLELEDFLQDVDIMRNDIERLAARIAYLQQDNA